MWGLRSHDRAHQPAAARRLSAGAILYSVEFEEPVAGVVKRKQKNMREKHGIHARVEGSGAARGDGAARYG